MPQSPNNGSVARQRELTIQDNFGDSKCNNIEDDFCASDGLDQKSIGADGPSPSKSLLQWKDMPSHLQFNPYIYTGYRPMLSVWGSIISLFYIHNETINILTHGKYFFFFLIFILYKYTLDFLTSMLCHRYSCLICEKKIK